MRDDNRTCHDMVVEVDELELLQQTVSPWKVEMQQLSAGKFHARERFAPVNSLLVTLENWNQRMITRGCSPPDHLIIGGIYSAIPVTWCDRQLDSKHLGIGIDSSEVAFVTNSNSLHWTVLIPTMLIEGRPGFENVRELAKHHILNCGTAQSERLRKLVSVVLQEGLNSYVLPEGHPSLFMMEYRILDAVAEILNTEQNWSGSQRQHAHWQHCLDAIEESEQLDSLARLADLATATGLSERVLQLSFKDTLGVTPHRFLQDARLHRVHQLLLNNDPQTMTVTAAMTECGFRELGRASGTYRKLFGERPSDTLRRTPETTPVPFAAAMRPVTGTLA